ncbi:Protein LURP-one-related 11 [Linum grandiflorum]
MSKIHPIFPSTTAAGTSASCSSDVTTSTETFTMWMKSLVMQGNGCTIYDQNGAVVYRVDNYQKKGCNEVYLMDLKGNLLFTILKTKLWPFNKQWKGYRRDEETASFRVVKKRRAVLGSELCCKISFRNGNASGGELCWYKMEASPAGKLTAFKITDGVSGGLVAEAKRKLQSGVGSRSGVMLGDDVLTLVVQPGVDRCFVMALATVYGLMSRRL